MMRKLKTKTLLSLILIALSIPASIAPVRAEPITVGVVLVAVGTGIVVGIAVNEFNSNYLNIAHAYATPDPDSNLVWKLGRSNPASALDFDLGPPKSWGAACAEAGFILDTIEAKEDCYGNEASGNYYNAARIYKNGQVNENATGGAPPAGNTQDLRVSLENLPVRQNVIVDMHTGKINSLDALVGGGALFTGAGWVPWRSTDETDPVIRDYLSGALPPEVGSDIPDFLVPSVDELFSADAAAKAVDWFPYFLSAVSSAGTYERDGQTFYNDFSFDVPLSQSVPLNGVWYTSVGVLQRNVVPAPSSALLLGIGLAALSMGRKRSEFPSVCCRSRKAEKGTDLFVRSSPQMKIA